MCGIAGVFNYGNGRPVERALVEAMTCSLAHRGPDDEGFHLDGSLALGMRRLSLELETGGHRFRTDSACSRYFKPAAIRTLVGSGRQDNNRALFSLLTFELWHEQFIRPGSTAVRAPQPMALEIA